MARIKFQDPQAQLHGTFIGMTYRVINGVQHAHLQLPDPLPKNPTKADRERHRKQQVTMWAVGSIQMLLFEQSFDQSIQYQQRLADGYNAYMHHARRKYDEWRERFDDDKRFARAIAYWYVTGKISPEFPELNLSSPASSISSK